MKYYYKAEINAKCIKSQYQCCKLDLMQHKEREEINVIHLTQLAFLFVPRYKAYKSNRVICPTVAEQTLLLTPYTVLSYSDMPLLPHFKGQCIVPFLRKVIEMAYISH